MKPLPSSFLPRLLSTLLLWGTIIAVVWMKSELGYCLLIVTAALGSLWEYFWLLKVSNLPRNWRIGYTAGISLLLGNCFVLHSSLIAHETIFAFDACIIVLTIVLLFFREFFRPQHSERILEPTFKVAEASKEQGATTHRQGMYKEHTCSVTATESTAKDSSKRANESLLDEMNTDAIQLLTSSVNRGNRFSAEGIAFTLFGIIYIPWLFSFLLKILYLTPRTSNGELTGTYYALLLIVITKFADVGAFLCGSIFGKHLFCPNISPKKTWEGFFGALALSLTCSLIFYFLFREHLSLLTRNMVIALSLLLAPIGIAGDLAESLLKRSLHTKDSSHTLPGIGGGMDLIDSILFTSPFFYFTLLFLLSRS